MKLIELVISVLLLSLCVLSAGFVYSSFMNNRNKTVNGIYEQNAHIKNDYRIRQIIREVSFNYLEDGFEEINQASQKIKELNLTVLNIIEIKDSNGFVYGLQVEWINNNSSSVYITKDLFMSKVLQSE